MKQNHIFLISPHLFVAAKSYREAKRMVRDQVRALQGDAIENAFALQEDISGIVHLSYDDGADTVRWEKEFRKAWGLHWPSGAEQFSTRAGDGLAMDDLPADDQVAWMESFHKKTGKRKNKR